MNTYKKQDFIAALEASHGHGLSRVIKWSFVADGFLHGRMTARISLPDGATADRTAAWSFPVGRASLVTFDAPAWDFDGLIVVDDSGAPLDKAAIAEIIEARTDIASTPSIFLDDVMS